MAISDSLIKPAFEGSIWAKISNITPGIAPESWPVLNSNLHCSYLVIMHLFSVVINSLILFTLRRTRSMHTPNNNLQVFLLANNLIFSLTDPIFSVPSAFARRWLFGYIGCQIYGFIGFVYGLCNIQILAAISIDRYTVICNPDSAISMKTHGKSLVACSVCFFISLFWSAMPLIGWSNYDFEPFQVACTVNWRGQSVADFLYAIGCFFTCFLSTLPVIIFCYVKISIKLREVKSSLRVHRLKQHSQDHQQVNMLKMPEGRTGFGGNNMSSSIIGTSSLEESVTSPMNDNVSSQFLAKAGREQNLINGQTSNLLTPSFQLRVNKLTRITPSNTIQTLDKVIHDGITPQELQIITTSIALTVSFMVAWTPYAILSIMGLCGYTFEGNPQISAFAPLLAKTSVVANPLLYSLRNTQLRIAVFKQFRRSSEFNLKKTVDTVDAETFRTSRSVHRTEENIPIFRNFDEPKFQYHVP